MPNPNPDRPIDPWEITFLASTWDAIDTDPAYRHDLILRLATALSAARRENAQLRAIVGDLRHGLRNGLRHALASLSDVVDDLDATLKLTPEPAECHYCESPHPGWSH